MNLVVNVAVVLAVIIGLAHSILGERYILIRLFKQDNLPKVLGSTEFTARTLRFAWHITTIAWWGFAAILFQLANGSFSASSVFLTIGVVFLATGLMTLVISRAKHFAWPVFLIIGGIALYAAST
jgi:hypothetical protein